MSDKPRLRVTLKSLASEAGVSPMVVSAVVRNDFSRIRVSEPRRQQIRRLIDKHGYVPSATAQSLVYQRTHIISVLVPSLRFFEAPFQFKLLSFLQQNLANADYRISICPCGTAKQDRDERLLNRIQADAGIFFHYGSGTDEALARAGRLPFPLLVFGHHPQSRHSACYLDNETAMATLTKRVLAAGHRKIAYVQASSGDAYNRDGFAGIQRSVADHGKAELAVIRLITHFPKKFHALEMREFGQQAAQALLKIPAANRPTAVIFSSDIIAACTIRILAEHGLSVPADLLVVANGCDDYSELLAPSLCKARPDPGRSGEACAQMLLDLIANPNSRPTFRAIPLTITGTDILPELS